MAINKINSNMIGAGDVSNAEHAYLNSVTSNVMAPLDWALKIDVNINKKKIVFFIIEFKLII